MPPLVSLFFTVKGNFALFVVPTTLKRDFALSDDGYRTIFYLRISIKKNHKRKKKHALVTQFTYRNYRFFVLLILRIFFSPHFPSRIRSAQVSGPRFTDTHLFRRMTPRKGAKDYHVIKKI